MCIIFQPGDVCPLELTQFQYTSWPDHGVPADCIAMTKFIKHVRKLLPYSDPCPLLVHCSAGVGRTGTFIVLDSMLERMKTEDTLDIYVFVKQLRNQRVLMVQTLVILLLTIPMCGCIDFSKVYYTYSDYLRNNMFSLMMSLLR